MRSFPVLAQSLASGQGDPAHRRSRPNKLRKSAPSTPHPHVLDFPLVDLASPSTASIYSSSQLLAHNTPSLALSATTLSRKLTKRRPSQSMAAAVPAVYTTLSDQDIHMARLQRSYPPSSYRSPEASYVHLPSLETDIPTSHRTSVPALTPAPPVPPTPLSVRSHSESTPSLQNPKKRSIRLSFRRKKRPGPFKDSEPRPPLPTDPRALGDGAWLPPLTFGTPISHILPGSQTPPWPNHPSSSSPSAAAPLPSSHWTSGRLQEVTRADGYKATWSLDFELDVDWDPDLEVWETNLNLSSQSTENAMLRPWADVKKSPKPKFIIGDEDAVKPAISPGGIDWQTSQSSHGSETSPSMTHASYSPYSNESMSAASSSLLSPLRPPIMRRNAAIGPVQRRNTAPGTQSTHRRWTLAMALMDDDITDEVLIRELEKVRMKQMANAMNIRRPTQGTNDAREHPTQRRLIISTASLPPFPSSFPDPAATSHERPLPPLPSSPPSSPPFVTSPTEDLRFSPPLPSPSPTWLSARRALLIVRELVRTERSYLHSLRALLLGHVSGIEPPRLMLAYAAELARVSEALLGRMEGDLCVKGVANAFIDMCGPDVNLDPEAVKHQGLAGRPVEGGLETAFIAWCGVVGGWFANGSASGDSRGGAPKARRRLSKARISIVENREKENKKPLRIDPPPRQAVSQPNSAVPQDTSSSSSGGMLSRNASSSQVNGGSVSPLKRTVSTWRKSMPSIPALGITRSMSVYGTTKARTPRRPPIMTQPDDDDDDDEDIFQDARESQQASLDDHDMTARTVWSSDGHESASQFNRANIPAWSSAQAESSSHGVIQDTGRAGLEGLAPARYDGDGVQNSKDRKLLTVRDLAILPTQRVMRYVLLYRDLLAHTPATSPSRVLVERAVEAASRVAQKCDRAQGNAAFLLQR
ncbi:hypothetical protein HGRIS_008327 [Hohenbuehelia grisea]|uniref:DH domain-containing protein n=1 Tax=Hohenbuehelia grisea TaxID=104357 RepID=A0ABR3J822_9AGAR